MSLFPTPIVSGGGEKKPDLGSNESALDRMASFMSGVAARNATMANALALTGDTPSEIYFPPEVIAGCCPHVEGREMEMAWQAAAEALDSERLHFVWKAHQSFVWFLAVRSSELSSHANSWCPFAAFLPGMETAAVPPVCYIYEDSGVAQLMTIAPGELHIHRGASTIIRAKAERLARDLGNAPITNVLPDQMDMLTPVPWQSLSLLEDKARRFLAMAGVVSGLMIAIVAFIIWLLATFASLTLHADVADAQSRSNEAAQELMHKALNLRVSPLQRQLARFTELNEDLIRVGGWLKEYKVVGDTLTWKAVLPPGVTADVITRLGGRTQEITREGIVVVGNK